MDLGADDTLLRISRNRPGRPVKSKTFLKLMPNNKYFLHQAPGFYVTLLATSPVGLVCTSFSMTGLRSYQWEVRE
jgi:hypothetical protein